MNRSGILCLDNIVEIIEGIVYVEEWVDVIGWEELYQVSSFGRVKSKNRYVNNYRSGKALRQQKILRQNIGKGYLHVLLYRNENEYSRQSLQRLVATHYIPNPLNKRTVNHKNTIKTDNFYKNLEWNTDSEQQLHAAKNGLRDNTLGSKSNFSKLEEDDIIEIRRLFDNKEKTRIELSTQFKVSKSTIQYIVNRQTWKHI